MRLVIVLCCALISAPATAYVGPGAGLSLLGSLWGLLIAVGVGLLMLVGWPIRRASRLLAERRAQSEVDDDD